MRHQASTKIITFFSHYHGILSITQMRLLLKHRLLIKRMLGGTQAGYKVSKLYIRIMVVYTSSGTYGLRVYKKSAPLDYRIPFIYGTQV